MDMDVVEEFIGRGEFHEEYLFDEEFNCFNIVALLWFSLVEDGFEVLSREESS